MNEGLQAASDLQFDAVGLLEDLTKERKLSRPEYKLIFEVGPAHRCMYTMKCKVGSVRRSAFNYNKKKAKQLCAKKVYECLVTYIPEPNPEPELEFYGFE